MAPGVRCPRTGRVEVVRRLAVARVRHREQAEQHERVRVQHERTEVGGATLLEAVDAAGERRAAVADRRQREVPLDARVEDAERHIVAEAGPADGLVVAVDGGVDEPRAGEADDDEVGQNCADTEQKRQSTNRQRPVNHAGR